jgi:hypothetical protein
VGLMLFQVTELDAVDVVETVLKDMSFPGHCCIFINNTVETCILLLSLFWVRLQHVMSQCHMLNHPFLVM